MPNTELLQIAVIILVAAVLGVLARLFRQPLILAYLATGALAGYLNFLNLGNRTTLEVFADLGIMFLLFLVGLEINYTSLRLVGRPSVIVGLGQIIFTAGIGYFIARFLDFGIIASLYIATALTFSSTIIIVKLLSEKKDLGSLYGKISVGVLLIQDIVAILILIALAGMQSGDFSWWNPALFAAKGIAVFGFVLWLGRKILPFVFDRAARSSELLFLISLAWLFLLVTLISRIGFSIEIAGLLAGLALANSSEHFQIASKIRPLRDFFILIFFVLLGASLASSKLIGIGWPVVVFSLFVLIGNPLIVLVLMGLMGYRKRTSFLTGLTVAQISEFSLVLAALGYKLGHLTLPEVSLITAVGIITITLSTYLILYGDKIFRRLTGVLSIFERRRLKEDWAPGEGFRKPIILIGAHRTGQSIMLNLPLDDLLVIDFDPEIIELLRKHRVDYLFGDIGDEEILTKANLGSAKLVISTSPDLEDNLALLEALDKLDRRPKTILRAETEKDAELLYSRGADYVLLPHFTSGQYLGKTIAVDPEMKILESLKQRDLEMLQNRKKLMV
jgi:Kef-type K+ transport system membrane component KefB